MPSFAWLRRWTAVAFLVQSQYITAACRLEIGVMARADVLGGSFPRGLPEPSEAEDDRLLHLTASRSNNCEAHLGESRRVTDQCRQVVSRPLLILPRTRSSTFSWGLSCIYLLHYIINFICAALCRNTVTKCFTDSKTGLNKKPGRHWVKKKKKKNK